MARARLTGPLINASSLLSASAELLVNSMMTNGLTWTSDAMSNGHRSMNAVLPSANHVQQQAAGDAAAAAVASAAQDDAYSDDTILAAADMDCIVLGAGRRALQMGECSR